MDKAFMKFLRDKSEVSLRYDPKTEAVWVYGKPKDCPCLTVSLLQQLHEVQTELIDYFRQENMKPKTPVKFLIYASQTPEIYSFGGNIEAIIDVIEKHDRDAIEYCAQIAIKSMYLNAMNLHLPLQTITLIEGAAMGGGFEAALSCGAIIAEEQSTFGLQQMRFNMLPGSGIYSFLARKVGMKYADEIIMGTQIYSAKEMLKMGAVDRVARRGEGLKEANAYMRSYRRSFEAMQALHAAKLRYRPFAFEELEYMAQLWVDSLMKLEPSHLQMLKKVTDAQARLYSEHSQWVRTKQDRRIHTTQSFPLVDSEGNVIERDRRVNPDPRAKNREN
jgi:DSF synthase